jgi:hypothetical protein
VPGLMKLIQMIEPCLLVTVLTKKINFCHACEGRHPSPIKTWIPASAGMTLSNNFVNRELCHSTLR